ncbi:MAG: YbjN domain-containing protein, partial [Bifidobacteriaceae bacterium]|nr:YbjN domain-containing protein [Bifidobacteriaceae bacterium]
MNDDKGRQVLAPLTRDRIEEVMRLRDWNYSIDSDGDLTGNWDHNRFYFFLTGKDKEILQVQSRWRQDLPIDLRSDVLVAINEWHQTRLWPKG